MSAIIPRLRDHGNTEDPIKRINSYMEKVMSKRNRKAMNRNWSNQKANPALKTKAGNKLILQIDKIR